jgi:cobalt-zinc-cadmium efflux system protein
MAFRQANRLSEGHNHSAAGMQAGKLRVVLLLTACVLVIELAAGLFTGSLALLADAGHMLTDVGALTMSLVAIWFGSRPATAAKSYGYYRLEILAALINGVLLWIIAGYILYEAYTRIDSPHALDGLAILLTAAAGLAVNLFAAWTLFEGQKTSLNIRGAFLEVVGDMAGSVAVLFSAAIILTTGFEQIDSIASVLIALFILPRTWKLIGEAAHVLLEGVPRNVNVTHIRDHILDTDGVLGVHDLHVWSLTSGVDVLSAHVVIDKGTESQQVLDNLCNCLSGHFDIEHCTFQIEQPDRREREHATH